MRVLFGVRNDGPDAYYRASAPASVLRYRGLNVEARAPILGRDADDFDVLILQRHVSSVAELVMAEFQDKGKPVIYDVDDWLFGIPPSWPVFGDLFDRGRGTPKPALEHHERMLRRANMVTCSTVALAERMAVYNERVRVLPNCIMMGDWDTVIPTEKHFDGPVVGWFGSFNHWDDWQAMIPVLDDVLAVTDASLAVVGYPEIIQSFPDRLAEKTLVQPAERFRNFQKIRRLITSFDIGLAWLVDTPFNRCKSPLKLFQYGGAGVPVIASRIVYGDLWLGQYSDVRLEEGANPFGFLADSLDGLAVTLTVALDHLKECKSIATRWQQKVWSNHSYETQYNRWLEVIEEVLG